MVIGRLTLQLVRKVIPYNDPATPVNRSHTGQESSVKKKLLVQDLKPGMFVSELDRPWGRYSLHVSGVPDQDREGYSIVTTS